jgi:hypothetical protein
MEKSDNKLSNESPKSRSYLSPQTFERMLHRWTDWSRSVEAARESPEIANYPLPESYGDRQKWIDEHGGRLWQYAVKVMHHLDLPEYLWRYWLCCVYSDYKKSDGSIDYTKIMDFHGNKRQRVNPPLPYNVDIEIIRPGKFGPVRIEIHPSFLYRALYEQAAIHAHRVAQTFQKNDLHPIFTYEPWARAQNTRSKVKENARTRVYSGQCEISDILTEEARRPQVLSEVEQIRKRGSRAEREKELRILRHRVLSRINKWFLDLKPRPRLRQKWWPYSSEDVFNLK